MRAGACRQQLVTSCKAQPTQYDASGPLSCLVEVYLSSQSSNPVAYGVKPMLKGKLVLDLNWSSDVQNTFMAKRQGSEVGRRTFARQPNVGSCLTPSKQQSGEQCLQGMFRSQHAWLQLVENSIFDLDFHSQNNVTHLPQCSNITRFKHLELCSSHTEVSDARVMSYDIFANGQIYAQTYVTLLHVCISCHGHLNSLHPPTSTAPGYFWHSFVGTPSCLIHAEELIGLLHCMPNSRHTQPPAALMPEPVK